MLTIKICDLLLDELKILQNNTKKKPTNLQIKEVFFFLIYFIKY